MKLNYHNRFIGLCALIILMISVHAKAQVPCEYDVTVIQAPVDCGFGIVITTGLGLNENGAVVGNYWCSAWEHTEAFVWSAEDGFITLDRPAGVSSANAVDINDNGVICGTVVVSGLGFRGFVYEDGKWTILDPVVPNGGWSSASAINNAGIVVGKRSISENLSPQVAYMWSEKDGFSHLDGLEKLSSATAIKGDMITGWTANTGEMKEGFLWDDENISLLGPIPGGFTSEPAAVTNQGETVGSGAIPMDGYQFGILRAFMWQKGKFTLLGTLPNHLSSSAQDIRANPQQIVGRSSNVDGNSSIAHGFLWENGVIYDLNDLIMSNSQVLITIAGTITQMRGDILALGTDAKGDVVAFLLTPVEYPLGDLDSDCDVDLDDLIALLEAWGKRDSPADLNQDGVVRTADLLILFANWG
ncbi:MAG: hypothetical protein IH984_01565 [Planctomycetes bacterium]|nr:hypothetical protein [Planctomycetota bacterium]